VTVPPYEERLFDVSPVTVTPTLTDRFVVPPFSVLDTRQGYWQERKRKWLRMGIASELGRGQDMLAMGSNPSLALDWNTSGEYDATARARYAASNLNGEVDLPDWANNGTAQTAPGTSIFDPVLCEVVYRWFSPHGGSIIDPFAGGSVRGIVAAALERIYVGCDLSGTQIAANVANASDLGITPHPYWIEGDSRNIRTLAPGSYDLIFTCPPYADLEVYSDDPRDISTLDYPAFHDAYRHILTETAALLAPDRFACIVISEVRHKHGHYHGLVPDTIRAMQDAGLTLYNEAVLINQVGTLALRTLRAFPPGRKLGRSHQNVLVFCKGDGRRAADACGPITSDYGDAADV